MARRGAAVGGPSPKMPGPPKAKGPTAAKAKAILSDGEVRGNALTAPQKGLFGAIAGGAKPRAPGLAIGQRPQLGARTKAAMKPMKPRGKTPFNAA